ncbi:MAG TPA: hypothetical protein VGF75_03710 [Candidatus Saccharimonadales bacterium]|jgi:hypothetical protein
MSTLILETKIPEYRLGQQPDRFTVGNPIDKLLRKNFSGKSVVLRCIGIQDHKNMTVDELAKKIVKIGIDKYDPSIKGLGYEVGEKKGKQIDFFGTLAHIDKDAEPMTMELVDDFWTSTQGDRGHSVRIDIVMVFDSIKLTMVENIYDGYINSDGYTFNDLDNKPDALIGVIIVR